MRKEEREENRESGEGGNVEKGEANTFESSTHAKLMM